MIGVGLWHIVATAILLSACSLAPDPGADDAADIGGTWTAVRVNELAAIPTNEPRVQFTHSGTEVEGVAGCSGFEGRVTIVGNEIQVVQLERTETSPHCQPAVREYEEAFARTFRSATQLDELGRGRLRLSGPAGEVLLIREGDFELSASETDFLETLPANRWTVVAGTGLPAGPQLAPIEFLDGEFAGIGECGFSGEYRLRGEDLIQLHQPGQADEGTCPPADDRLRAQLFQLLESVSRYELDEGSMRLTLRGRDTELVLEAEPAD